MAERTRPPCSFTSLWHGYSQLGLVAHVLVGCSELITHTHCHELPSYEHVIDALQVLVRTCIIKAVFFLVAAAASASAQVAQMCMLALKQTIEGMM